MSDQPDQLNEIDKISARFRQHLDEVIASVYFGITIANNDFDLLLDTCRRLAKVKLRLEELECWEEVQKRLPLHYDPIMPLIEAIPSDRGFALVNLAKILGQLIKNQRDFEDLVLQVVRARVDDKMTALTRIMDAGVDEIFNGQKSQPDPAPTPAHGAAPSTQPKQYGPGALGIYQEKLDRLLEAAALESDAARKFSYEKQIQEARAMIQQLGG
jgi:hypothetical protein